jgi:hypothetical protein
MSAVAGFALAGIDPNNLNPPGYCMTPEEYTAALALASAEIVAAVHRNEDSGPYISCALSIQPAVGVDPIYTLIALLAAQVNPDTSLEERLMWTRPEIQDVLKRERAA